MLLCVVSQPVQITQVVLLSFSHMNRSLKSHFTNKTAAYEIEACAGVRVSIYMLTCSMHKCVSECMCVFVLKCRERNRFHNTS